MPDVPLDVLAGRGGPWVLVGLAVLSVLRGWLVPRATVDRERQLLEQRIADLLAAHNTAREQVSELLELGRTTTAVLQSLPRPPTKGRAG
jgi:hypothetical protein